MKSFNAMKIFVEIHRDNHLNMMVNEVIGKVETAIPKNQKQALIYFQQTQQSGE